MKTLIKTFVIFTMILFIGGITSAMEFNFHFDNVIDPAELKREPTNISRYAQSKINKRIFDWTVEITNDMNMHPFLDKQKVPMPNIYIVSDEALRDTIRHLLRPRYLYLVKRESREYADEWLKHELKIIVGTFVPPVDIYLRASLLQCKLESKIAHEIYHYLHWQRWGNRENAYGPDYPERLDEVFARQVEKQYYRIFCKEK